MTRMFAQPLDLSWVDDAFLRRFWSKVDVGSPDECWEWNAYRKPGGYGQFTVRKGVFMTSSRVALALTVGPLGLGIVACHACDNPPCTNPAHLFAGTQSDNTNDSVSKGRGNRSHGEATGSAKLTEAQVEEIRAHPHYYGIYSELGRQYGVAANTIRSIRLYVKWRHVA